ncbi:hypothetical protein ACROYT_G022954 [Oculina patagonica]
MILSLKANQPKVYKPRPPIPTPRKSVKQMIDDYEENIIQPPLKFRDDYRPTPKPRTIKPKKPVPLPRTKIEQVSRALKGYTKSFEIGIKHNKDPLLQLQNTRKAVEYHIIKELSAMKGLKFAETLKCFSSERVLNDHKENCIQVNGVQAIKMPDKDNNILKFNNFHKQQQVPFVIYADFEAITEKISSCKPNNDKSYTEAYQKHQDCGYGYKVVCCYDDQYSKPVQIYRGEKAVYKFMEKMLDEIKYCKKVMKKHFNKPLKMTKDNEENFKNAKACHICDKQYTDDDIRVRDHCHIIGKYRGSAHQECNLKLRIESDKIKIPVIFHNLRGYDSHFIMQEIGAIVKNHTYKNKKGEIKEMNINAIPNNMEKYMAFMLGNHLNFIDSFQFMSSSLEQLVSNLPRESLKYTSNMFKGKKLNLMTRKGVYPYDYMDSFNKFNEGLPTKEDFYSILNNEHISDKDYKHVRNVCKTFKLKTMGEYHDLYLQSDVLLLADVFENFRKTCFKYYGLDPCWYFSSPNLSWDAMLKMTGIKLELMTDIDMYQFIEKGMRGVLCSSIGVGDVRDYKNFYDLVPPTPILLTTGKLESLVNMSFRICRATDTKTECGQGHQKKTGRIKIIQLDVWVSS